MTTSTVNFTTTNHKQSVHTAKSRIHAIGVLLTQVDGVLSEVYEMALEIELEELQSFVHWEENKSSCEEGV